MLTTNGIILSLGMYDSYNVWLNFTLAIDGIVFEFSVFSLEIFKFLNLQGR